MRQINQNPRVQPLRYDLDRLVLEWVVPVFVNSLGTWVQELESFRIRLVLAVLEHPVSSDIGRISRDVQLFLSQTVGHVIVLTAPSPEHVGESIDLPELIDSHGWDATENVIIGEPIQKAAKEQVFFPCQQWIEQSSCFYKNLSWFLITNHKALLAKLPCIVYWIFQAK